MWQYISAAAQAASSAPMFMWRHADNRVELSGISFLNAVSKAANFIADGLDVEAEQTVHVDLGNHWQSPVWQCAVLATGAVLSDEPSDFNIVNSAKVDSVSNVVAVVSRDPFGMPERDLPSTVINASAEVRGFGDYFAPRTALSETTVLGTWGVDVQQARDLAANNAKHHGIEQGQPIGLALSTNPRTAVEWQCFFSIFNRSPLILLDGDFDQAKVEQQERVTQLIDLR